MDEEEDTSVPVDVGAQLRAAREQRGLTLEQVAAETRIAQRHLTTIEEGRFAELPARTYAIGFSRSYARLVDLDQDAVADLVRAELDVLDDSGHHNHSGFEPGDPARVPSGNLVWLSAAAVVLLLIGGFFFLRILFSPAAELLSLVEQEEAERAAELAAASEAALEGEPLAGDPPRDGEVVFTALEEGIWVKFYDSSGRQLMQKLMEQGERYSVPADANGPRVWTGRPDAFAITIGGHSVPKLSEDERVMRDVPVSAEALLDRSTQAPTRVSAPQTVVASVPSPSRPVRTTPSPAAPDEVAPPPSATESAASEDDGEEQPAPAQEAEPAAQSSASEDPAAD